MGQRVAITRSSCVHTARRQAGRRFGERKARLEKAVRPMSDCDLAIGVHALAYGLTLVTADRAFERLELRQENWLA